MAAASQGATPDSPRYASVLGRPNANTFVQVISSPNFDVFVCRNPTACYGSAALPQQPEVPRSLANEMPAYL